VARYYTLYISNDGVHCGRVVDYLDRKQIDCLTINVDDEGDNPPKKVVFYPVLFENDEILAYGLDIIEHFQLNKNRP